MTHFTGRSFDMTGPCKHCPFRNDATRLTFACAERAREIEESAYRNGFPCHSSADLIENTDFEDGGYVFGDKTQHCAGYIIMKLNEGLGEWPGIDNDEELHARLEGQMDLSAPVFQDTEEFLEANGASE